MNVRRHIGRGRWLAGAAGAGLVAAMALAPAAAAQAQPVQADFGSSRTLSIAPGPLADALRQFGQAFGIQFVYGSELVQGVGSPGVSGSQTARAALDRLLAGTHLAYRFVNARTIAIEAVPAMGAARVLGSVQVEGVQNEGFVPLNGFGAGAGANGSSDPTATEGTGSLTTNGASVASKTAASLKDTPQSVTVITQERIQQQNLTDLNSALNYTPGIAMVDNGGGDFMILSRGFTVNTYQIDGGGPIQLQDATTFQMPPNLAEYDSIQVLRGSDGLFGGAGSPSGVINLQRKRPLDHDQFIGEVDIGSWNNYRAQVDATGPIGLDGHIRARLVLSYQDRDFFYDIAHQSKGLIYGVLEADLDPNTIIRVGGSIQLERDPGLNFSGLPRYSDGGDIGFSRATCFCTSWTRENTRNTEAFVELDHKFNADWSFHLNASGTWQDRTGLTPFFSGTIGRTAASTEFYAQEIQNFDYGSNKYAVDAHLNGGFELFGLKQTILIGADYSKIADSNTDLGSYPYTPTSLNPFDFNQSFIGPVLTNSFQETGIEPESQSQYGIYLKADLRLLPPLHISGGVRISGYSDSLSVQFLQPPSLGGNYSYIYPTTNARAATPYASISYDVSHLVSIYFSYADIYQPQFSDVLASGGIVPPETGVTYESGIKGSFNNGRINASLSVYYTDEANVSYYLPGVVSANPFCCYAVAAKELADGVDFEVAGEVLPRWQVQFGYNFNENSQPDFKEEGLSSPVLESQQPKHQIKLWTSYVMPGRFNRWTIGGGVRMESKRYQSGTVCPVVEAPSEFGLSCPTAYVPFNFTQGFYAVADLRAEYSFNNHWRAAVGLTNITDTRYYETAGTNQAGNFYGEPRAVMFTLRAAY